MKTYPSQQTYDTLPSFQFESGIKTDFGKVKVDFLFTDLAYCCGISVLSNLGVNTDDKKLVDKAFGEFYDHLMKHTTQAQIILAETPNKYRKTQAFITWLIKNKPKDFLVSNGYVGNALYLGAQRGGAIRTYIWVPEQRQFCYKVAPVAYGKLQPMAHQEDQIMDFVAGRDKGYCRFSFGTAKKDLNFYKEWRSKAFSDYETFEKSRL